MPGPPPQPIELRLLRGNPGKRPVRGGLRVERPPEPPEPPEFLSAYAKEEWARVAPELWRLRLLTELDVSLFAVYCDAVGVWRDAVETINRMAANDPVTKGLLVKGANGEAVRNPLIAVERHSAALMLEVAAQFGMTPAARSRIAAGAASFGPSSEGKFAGLIGRCDDRA